MKIKLIALVLLLNLCSYAQKSSEYDYGIPLPPESYQFKKRLMNNVSLYTGQPSIDIPIYTISLDGMEVPISISYNTGGIKVEEDATSIGLGWSLNIGGQITRDNHGLPDERYFIHKPYNDPFGVGGLKETLIPNNNGQYVCGTPAYSGRMEFYDNAFRAGDNITTNYPMADSRPDEFYYSFFGHSGKFMFSQELKKFITFPLDDITIDYEIGTLYTNPKYFDSFNIKLPSGYSLILGKDGRSSISYLLGTPFDQSWQLKKIISPKNKEITYNYISANYNLYTGLTNPTTHVITRSKSDFNVTSYENNKTNNIEKLISEINFPNGRVIFTYGDRLDLQTGAKKLQEIKIFDNSNNLIRKIEFIQTYFEANENLFSQAPVNKRLKLNSLRFYDTKNNAVENYNFDYYLFDKIPSKSSKAQDHWGYFNGKTSNESLFPKNLLPFYYTVESNLGFNRNIDTLYTKTFSLKSIKYPEGSIKYYNYENHKALVNPIASDYYDAISDERFSMKEISFTMSGYDLKTFIPAPSEINSFNKVFYSEPFETSVYSQSLKSGEISILINSNIPFRAPNYSNINAEYNQVEFYIEKKQENGTYSSKYLGTISKNQNTSGLINSYFDVGGKGTYRMKFIVTQNYYFSNPNDYNFYHYTSFRVKYREKTKDEVFVGGLRIKSINTYTNDNLIGPKYTTNFKYLNDYNITSGKMMNIPSYAEYISIFVPDVPMEGQAPSPELQLGVRLSSSSTLSLYKTSSSNVGYSKVTQIDYDNIKKTEIKEDNYFSFQNPLFSEIWPFEDSREYEPKDWHRGKLLNKIFYNNNSIVKEEKYTYYGEQIEQNMGFVDEINYQLLDNSEFCRPQSGVSKHIFPINVVHPSLFSKGYPTIFDHIYAANKYSIENSSTFGIPGAPASFKIPYFKIYTGFDKIKSKTTIDYFGDNSISQTENYFYNSTPTSIQLSSQTNVNSKGETIETKYYYVQDAEMANEPFRNELLAKNMIGIPLKQESFKGANKLSEKRTQYGSFPSPVVNQPNILPQYIYTKKGNIVPDQLEKKVSYQTYDTFGNLTQYSIENGNPVSIIWGYNQTLPIAKIENATNAQIASDLGISSINNLNETNLATINTLRSNLPNAMVTTYTYIPLVGVSTITDPKGQTTTYTYDSFGRLEFVKDNKGNILSENQYNYKH